MERNKLCTEMWTASFQTQGKIPHLYFGEGKYKFPQVLLYLPRLTSFYQRTIIMRQIHLRSCRTSNQGDDDVVASLRQRDVEGYLSENSTVVCRTDIYVCRALGRSQFVSGCCFVQPRVVGLRGGNVVHVFSAV